VIDATCPLVRKVHNEAIKFSTKNIPTVLIGHKKHQEIIGTSGYIQKDLLHLVEDVEEVDALDVPAESQVAYLTQTTFSVDETQKFIERLKEKYPKLLSPLQSDICYATQIRQDAIKELAGKVDMIIVCGSLNSSNSNRLRETGERSGVKSIIIDSAKDLDLDLLTGKKTIGISSGASVPQFIVEELVDKIKEVYPDTKVHSFENPEKNISFPLPEIN